MPRTQMDDQAIQRWLTTDPRPFVQVLDGNIERAFEGAANPALVDSKKWYGYTEDGATYLTRVESRILRSPRELYTVMKDAQGKFQVDIKDESFSGEIAFDMRRVLKYKDGRLEEVFGDDSIFTDEQKKRCKEVYEAQVFLEEGGKSIKADIGELSPEEYMHKNAQRLKAVSIPPGIAGPDGKTSICPMGRNGDKITIDLGAVAANKFSGRIWLKDKDGKGAAIEFKDGKAVGLIPVELSPNPKDRCTALDPEIEKQIRADVKRSLVEQKSKEAAAKAAPAGVAPQAPAQLRAAAPVEVFVQPFGATSDPGRPSPSPSEPRPHGRSASV